MMLYHVLPGGGLKPCDTLPDTHIQIHNCATFTLYLPATLVTPRMEAPFYGLIWGDAIVDVASAANFVDAVKHFHAPLWRTPHHAEPVAEKRNVRRRTTKKASGASETVGEASASETEGEVSEASASEADGEVSEADGEVSEVEASEADEDDAEEPSLVQDESEDAADDFGDAADDFEEDEVMSPAPSEADSDDDV